MLSISIATCHSPLSSSLGIPPHRLSSPLCPSGEQARLRGDVNLRVMGFGGEGVVGHPPPTHFSTNFTGRSTQLATGFPAFRAGRNVHSLTESTAARSRIS